MHLDLTENTRRRAAKGKLSSTLAELVEETVIDLVAVLLPQHRLFFHHPLQFGNCSGSTRVVAGADGERDNLQQAGDREQKYAKIVKYI